MALFTDAGPASIEDMTRYDSACEQLAHEAAINLDNKLAVAADEVGQEILGFLLSQGGAENRGERMRRQLGDVVVTPQVRRWHATRALAGLYRDAYSSEVTDRYRMKWKEYEKLANEAQEHAFTSGIGLVHSPIPKAPFAVIAATGGAVSRTLRSVRIAWVASDGSEGAPAMEYAADLGPGDQISAPGPVPTGVSGWNVYLGTDGGTPLRQNAEPVSIGTFWTVPESEPVEGEPAGDGQPADYYVVERRILSRW
jgi:hypothetical protein